MCCRQTDLKSQDQIRIATICDLTCEQQELYIKVILA